jgi:DNA polymerase delta subunit 1
MICHKFFFFFLKDVFNFFFFFSLCYSTFIKEEQIRKYGLNQNDYTITPSGSLFVKKQVREGVLPSMLKHVIEARSKAKKELKEAKDPLSQIILNGRQLALKIVANSMLI